MKIFKIAKLEDAFFNTNSDLKEALHTSPEGDRAQGKERGYGVVIVRLEGGITFGIPLRSNMKHKHGFSTVESKGLDYSKAVIIKDPAHIKKEPFVIPSKEFIKISDRELFIRERFEKYIKKYIKAVKNGDENILREYKFSTLVNYHDELMPPDEKSSAS